MPTERPEVTDVKEELLRSLPHVSLWLEERGGEDKIAVHAGLLVRADGGPRLVQFDVDLRVECQQSVGACLDRVVSRLIAEVCADAEMADFYGVQRSGLALLADLFAEQELDACFQWVRRSRDEDLATLPAHGKDRFTLLTPEASARLCQERFTSNDTIFLFQDMLGQLEEKKRQYHFSYINWDVEGETEEETKTKKRSTKGALLRVRGAWKEDEDLAVAVGYPLHFFLLVRERGQWTDCNTLPGLGKEAADAIVGGGTKGPPEMAQLGVRQASGTACGVYSCLFLLAFALGMEDLKDVLVPFQDQKGRDDTVAMRRWLFRSCAVGRVDLGPWREKEEK